MTKKENLKLVDEDIDTTFRQNLRTNSIKSRSTKKMTEYYNSTQFKNDLAESEMEAKAHNNNN